MRRFFQVSLILGFFSFILLWILPAHAEIGVHVKAPYNYSVSVSSSPQAYTINTPITFSVKVTNDGKFVIHDLDVIAPFSSLMAENIHGQSIVALNNISISSTQEGSNTDAGEYANTGDLSATNVSIGIGGSVTYSISATVADLLLRQKRLLQNVINQKKVRFLSHQRERMFRLRTHSIKRKNIL